MSYVQEQDGKRRRITEDAQLDEEMQHTANSYNDVYPRATRTSYLSTNVQGSATAVVGDNYGTLITHHHHQLAPTESKRGELLLESLTFGAMGARLRNVNPALARTCQWLRSHKHFLSWISHDRQQVPNDFLWLKGKPGSGKSTIMRNTLIWMEKEYPAHIILSYFFDARSPFQLAKSSLGLYRSILHQLLSSCADIRDLFVERFSNKVALDVVEPWTEQEIQNFLIDLIEAGSPPALMVFIDALDESHDDDVQELVAFLQDLQQRATESGVRLRVCFSSRHYPHITIIGNSITIEDQLGHEEDISLYVRTRLLGGGQTGIDEIRQMFLRKAAGVFLWVALMVSRLNQQFNRGKGLPAMMQELERVSPSIQDLFYDILTRDQDEMGDCIVLLRFVLHAKRPLQPEELYRAVRKSWHADRWQAVPFDSGAVFRYVMACSRGLVEFTKSERVTVQFIHETVRETLANNDFMQESESPWKWPMALEFSAQVCHASITELCLSCLLSSDEMEPNSWSEKGRHSFRCPEAFADYSAEFWWQHLQETTGSPRQPLLKLASSLLTTSRTRLTWLYLRNIDCAFVPLRRPLPGLLELVKGPREYGSLIYYAVLASIPELVREYIVAGVDVNAKGGRFDTPLGAAASLGQEEIVQILIEAGADIDGGFDYCPLIWAAAQNHEQVLKMLMQNGAKLDRITPEGTALDKAISEGHEGIVQLLLQHGANVNGRDTGAGDSKYPVPLCAAVHAGRSDITRLLLEHGARVKHEHDGWVLTDHAFILRNWEMLELLLQWGIGLDPHSLKTKLEYLKSVGRWELMSMLEDARPDSDNSKDNENDEDSEDNEDNQDSEHTESQAITNRQHLSSVMSIGNICN